MPQLDLATVLAACAGIGLAVLLSVLAGVLAARVFFHATREADEDSPSL